MATIHDVTYYMAGGANPTLAEELRKWSMSRNQYEVDQSQIPLKTMPPLTSEVDPHSPDAAEASLWVVWRYLLTDAGWQLIARETNFNSNWGPAYTVFR